MAFSNVHYVSIYQTVTSLTYVFVLLAFRPRLKDQRGVDLATSRGYSFLLPRSDRDRLDEKDTYRQLMRFGYRRTCSSICSLYSVLTTIYTTRDKI